MPVAVNGCVPLTAIDGVGGETEIIVKTGGASGETIADLWSQEMRPVKPRARRNKRRNVLAPRACGAQSRWRKVLIDPMSGSSLRAGYRQLRRGGYAKGEVVPGNYDP